MSILKFELKKEHLELVKYLNWDNLKDGTISTEPSEPFGSNNSYDDMGIILYGKPEDFDPFNYDGDEIGNPFKWSLEQLEEMETLLSELPQAIEVILNAQTFEPGMYKTRYNDKSWKKIK